MWWHSPSYSSVSEWVGHWVSQRVAVSDVMLLDLRALQASLNMHMMSGLRLSENIYLENVPIWECPIWQPSWPIHIGCITEIWSREHVFFSTSFWGFSSQILNLALRTLFIRPFKGSFEWHRWETFWWEEWKALNNLRRCCLSKDSR